MKHHNQSLLPICKLERGDLPLSGRSLGVKTQGRGQKSYSIAVGGGVMELFYRSGVVAAAQQCDYTKAIAFSA